MRLKIRKSLEGTYQNKGLFNILWEKHISKVGIWFFIIQFFFQEGIEAGDLKNKKIPSCSHTTNDKWTPEARLHLQASTLRFLGQAQLVTPLAQDDTSLLFMDLRIFRDSKRATEGNAGLAYRKIITSLGWIFGGYGFFDNRRSEHHHSFQQLTLGVEALSVSWDFRANIYVPLSSSRSISSHKEKNTKPVFRGHQEFVSHRRETPHKGIDIEVGRLIPYSDNLRLYIAGYHFRGHHTRKINGIRPRIEWQLTENFMIEAAYRYDNVRHGVPYVGFWFSIPFGEQTSKKLTPLEKRMQETIIRDIDIITQTKQKERPTDRKFIFAKAGGTGGGTFESPADSNNSKVVAKLLRDNPTYLYYDLGTGTICKGSEKLSQLQLFLKPSRDLPKREILKDKLLLKLDEDSASYPHKDKPSLPQKPPVIPREEEQQEKKKELDRKRQREPNPKEEKKVGKEIKPTLQEDLKQKKQETVEEESKPVLQEKPKLKEIEQTKVEEEPKSVFQEEIKSEEEEQEKVEKELKPDLQEELKLGDTEQTKVEEESKPVLQEEIKSEEEEQAKPEKELKPDLQEQVESQEEKLRQEEERRLARLREEEWLKLEEEDHQKEEEERKRIEEEEKLRKEEEERKRIAEEKRLKEEEERKRIEEEEKRLKEEEEHKHKEEEKRLKEEEERKRKEEEEKRLKEEEDRKRKEEEEKRLKEEEEHKRKEEEELKRTGEQATESRPEPIQLLEETPTIPRLENPSKPMQVKYIVLHEETNTEVLIEETNKKLKNQEKFINTELDARFSNIMTDFVFKAPSPRTPATSYTDDVSPPFVTGTPTKYDSSPTLKQTPTKYDSSPTPKQTPTKYDSSPTPKQTPTKYDSSPTPKETPTKYDSSPTPKQTPTKYDSSPTPKQTPTKYDSSPTSKQTPTKYDSSPDLEETPTKYTDDLSPDLEQIPTKSADGLPSQTQSLNLMEKIEALLGDSETVIEEGEAKIIFDLTNLSPEKANFLGQAIMSEQGRRIISLYSNTEPEVIGPRLKEQRPFKSNTRKKGEKVRKNLFGESNQPSNLENSE